MSAHQGGIATCAGPGGPGALDPGSPTTLASTDSADRGRVGWTEPAPLGRARRGIPAGQNDPTAPHGVVLARKGYIEKKPHKGRSERVWLLIEEVRFGPTRGRLPV